MTPHTVRLTHRFLAAATLVAVCTRPASANAGSPMFWAGWFHLMGLNVLIGVLEGVVINLAFLAPLKRSIPLMIAANYVSFPIGFALNGLAGALLALPWMPPPLYSGRWVFGSMILIAFVISVVVECPFCFVALNESEDRVGRAWKASLLAQTCSYSVMIPFYLQFALLGLYRNAKIGPIASFVKPPVATVYFLRPVDNTVWRIHTDGSAAQRVIATESRSQDLGLSLRPSASGKETDLWLVDKGMRTAEHPQRLLVRNVAPRSALPATHTLGTAQDKRIVGGEDGYDSFDFGGPNDFRPQNHRPWSVTADGYTADVDFEGLAVVIPHHTVRRIAPDTTEESFSDPVYDLSFHTPFATFGSSYATILPNEQVVFESAGQVLLLDEPTRKLGVLAIGKSPVVVLAAGAEVK